MAVNSQEYLSLLKDEKEQLEIVNSDLIRRLEHKEFEIVKP